MKLEITKSFRFEACHSLPHLPRGHQCRRKHGHSYEVIIGVKGSLMPRAAWVQDYADISKQAKKLIKKLDHRNINKILHVPTTAENLARWFAKRLAVRLPLLSRVEIRETPTSNVILLIGGK